MSEQSIVIDPPIDDVNAPDVSSPWAGHKLGGQPYFINRGEQLETDAMNCMQGGYTQLLQLDAPVNSGDASVSGPWPFVNGLFHVLDRRQGDSYEFLWFFEL